MQELSDFRSRIPANKFTPPRLAPNRVLKRSRLIRNHLDGRVPCCYMLLEAQPGQGKTTVAIQFIDYLDAVYIWYQVGVEDRDPLYFLSALLEGVQRTVPDCICPRLFARLQHAEVGMEDATGTINLLLTQLAQVLSRPCIFVFDDLHLLADAPGGLNLVDHMLETAPENISFLLISRNPLAFSSKRLRYSSSILYLDNGDLAFSREETGDLLEILQSRPADPRTVAELTVRTEGWVMGMVLAAGRRTGSDGTGPSLPEINADRLMSYFEEELFDRLDEEQQQVLLRLALLDDIVVKLAREITGRPDVKKILLRLMDENYFIRSLDNEASLFSLHHLFLSMLRGKAEQLLSSGEQENILKQAAQYALERGRIGQGLRYLRRAGAFSELEQQLRRRGMELVFMNRLPTLASVLDKISAERIDRSAWFSLFSGFLVQKTDPARSLAFFHRAEKLFRDEGHSRGELVVLGELIYFYILFAPDTSRCTEYLHRADALFAECGAELSAFCRASTAKNIGTGCFYFLNDFERALKYTRTAEDGARESGAPSQLQEILVARGIIYLYQGKFKQAEEVAERVYGIMNSSDCGLRGQLAGLYFLFQVLYLKGEYQGYSLLKQAMLPEVDQQKLDGTLFQAYLLLYDVGIAVAEGNPGEALALIDEHLERTLFKTVNHLRNEMLATKAQVLAQCGRFEPQGREIAEQILSLVGEDATPAYRLKLLIPLAMAFAVGGDPARARKLADLEIELACEHKILLFEIYGRLLRAFIATLDDGTETVRADLKCGFAFMRREGINQIRCFSPLELLAVCKLAVTLDVYPDFAGQLAADVLGEALDNNAARIPLLTITTFGNFNLTLEGSVVGRAGDFTVAQRQLLGLLISQPTLEISQEQVQIALWPSSSETKGRNSFDAVLYRLRKVFADLLPNQHAGNYLVFERGILSLRNCRLDAKIFSDEVQQGLVLLKEKKWWQAGCTLDHALGLWSGSFAADLLPGDESSAKGWELLTLLTRLGLSWCPALAANGQLEKAVRVAAKIWQENPLDEQLSRLLYALYLQAEQPVQARRVYDRYEELLRKEGYPRIEIEQLLAGILSKDHLCP